MQAQAPGVQLVLFLQPAAMDFDLGRPRKRGAGQKKTRNESGGSADYTCQFHRLPPKVIESPQFSEVA